SVAGGLVYVLSEEGGLMYALDGATGDEVWRYETGREGDWRSSTPVIVDGVLFIGSDSMGLLALE
ncbi:MAG: PQQ-binding-like beta-propeller repeat protein, partial [Chloroflexota bacterium]